MTYCRALAFSGVPTARLPIVPASICTCARAFSSENRGAGRVHPDRRISSTTVHRFTRTAYQLPETRSQFERHTLSSRRSSGDQEKTGQENRRQGAIWFSEKHIALDLVFSCFS